MEPNPPVTPDSTPPRRIFDEEAGLAALGLIKELLAGVPELQGAVVVFDFGPKLNAPSTVGVMLSRNPGDDPAMFAQLGRLSMQTIRMSQELNAGMLQAAQGVQRSVAGTIEQLLLDLDNVNNAKTPGGGSPPAGAGLGSDAGLVATDPGG